MRQSNQPKLVELKNTSNPTKLDISNSDTILWGPVASGVLFRLNELGLWPNDPIRGRRHI